MKFIPIRYKSNLSVFGHGVLSNELYDEVITITGNYTIGQSDEFLLSIGDNTITVNANSVEDNKTVVIKNGDGTTTIICEGGVTIDQETTITLYPYESITLKGYANKFYIL